MVRRSFLHAMSALPLASAAAAADNPKTRYYTLECFFMKNGDQAGRLHEFLSKGFVPALRNIHSGPQLFLEAVVAPHLPQVAVILGFPSAADALSVYSKLHQQPGYNQVLEAWEAAPNQPYEHASLSLLEATPFSPEIQPIERPKTPRVFELRVYHSPTWRQWAALNDRFAGPEIQIFHRSGIYPLLYTSTVFGSNLPNLTYLTPFENLAAREKAWTAFGGDPEWIKVRNESVAKHGEIASVIQISFFRATPYSPVQ
jgi:hypothetical protein